MAESKPETTRDYRSGVRESNRIKFAAPRALVVYDTGVAPDGRPTMSAHPAKFSPEDKYSRERILIKKRFGILPTQLPPLKY